MRIRQILFALTLSLTSSVADEAGFRAGNDPRTDAAIRELVRRGAVVKRFTVVESETNGLLVRLKSEHLGRDGEIDAHILATLVPLNELTLELRGLPLRDAGLKSLLATVRLVGLDVSGSRISNCGLQELASTRSKLRLLDLSFTQISDGGMQAVASQAELRHLSLINCRVTDCGLTCVPCLTELRELYLTKTSVSQSATEQLGQQLPKCRIER